MSRALTRPVARIEITADQAVFCKRRVDYLLRYADTETLLFLLANAYHQGLSDAHETLTRQRQTPPA